MDVRAALKAAMHRLREARVPSHTLAAELLLMHTLGRDRAWLYAHHEEPLDAPAAEEYFALIAQRAAGTPTQYLTGHQEFWGLDFEVAPGVLIPRPETEHVIEVALERLGPASREQALRIADVGTGSGCIAVALAKELPRATLFATDISAPALAIAGRNAARHGVAERIQFLECNLLEGVGARLAAPCFDLIASNPPYIAHEEAAGLPTDVRDHEPHQALFGGTTGAEIYPQLIAQSATRLRPGGWLVVELGYNSLPLVHPLLDSQAWTGVTVTNDLAGTPRVLAASKT
jgi:release factor glutamine methyltransferase